MVVHSKNEALICKVFPSSLGAVAMRWFDGLGAGFIDSFKELTRAFGSRFITCSRVPRPLDSLLSVTMRKGKTLKTYSNRYWEMFNEIDGDFDDVAIRTFKASLSAEHGLRKSLTGKPINNVHQLMDRIVKYKWVEENQQLRKRKAKVVSQDRRDFRSDKYNDNRPRRDFTRQTGATTVPQTFLYRPNGQEDHVGSGTRGNTSSRPHLGTINVIFAALRRTGLCPSRVMSVARSPAEDSNSEPKKIKVRTRPAVSFSENDKFGTIQPHDDALVVTLRIGGYDVRHVLVDQGSRAKIIYLDLYKGLGLKPEDLISYDSPLVGFDGKVVIPMGQIKLPVQIGSEVVEVNFKVVDAYSPYTAIVARPWLHAMGAVSSTLHLKVKYSSGDQVEELIGSQSMARQCLLTAIRHQAKGESSASNE
ncbi:uncharacterized protein LOC142634385 [Castanea sativa]|uniref:uncharacterized protein LOC142634385 n=1 Tax=Castanea sativa TaxID=21020 RepID=UPI003F64C70D